VKHGSRIDSVSLDAINPPKDWRRIIPANVDSIANSMLVEGQLEPIGLVPAKERGRYDLKWGEHRRLAAIKIGWTHINAVVLRGVSQDHLDLMTLDENLARSSGYSCVLEEAIMRAEQKKKYLRLHPRQGVVEKDIRPALQNRILRI
jgi:ParB-like chromosome segregation protein Spo0J